MELWPTDHRRIKPRPKQKNTKEDETAVVPTETLFEIPAAGPVLWPGNGTLTAAILRPFHGQYGKNRLEWDFVAREGNPFRVLSGPSTLFPERPWQTTVETTLSRHRQAEEGARFLRQRFPDIDIPFEIIKETMEEDLKDRKMHEIHYRSGNCLAAIHLPAENASDSQAAFAFPMGEGRNQLNLSRASWSRSKGLVFDPAPAPVASFDTPIRQIVATEALHGVDAPTFAVRTMSLCSLFSINNVGGGRNRHSPLLIEQLASVKTTETGSIMDLASSPFDRSQMLLVNNLGRTTLVKVNEYGHETVAWDAAFDESSREEWRICWGSMHDEALRASTRAIELVDLRSGEGTLGLEFGPKEIIVHLEGHTLSSDPSGHRFVVTTNKRVCWLDDRYLTIPLLSWQHMRVEDTTLVTQSYRINSVSTTFLMSQKNGLINIFDVDTGGDMIHSAGSKQVVRTVSGTFEHEGHAIYRHPTSEATGINLVELSAQGGLFGSYLMRTSPTTAMESDQVHKGAIKVEWTHEMEELSGSLTGSFNDIEPTSTKESFQADFNDLYQDLVQTAMKGFPVEAEVEDIREMLDRMPRMWEELDHPLEDMMNTYDVAAICSAESNVTGRSQFLTNSSLDSRRANVAFENSQFPSPDIIAKNTAWSFDLSQTIQSIQNLDTSVSIAKINRGSDTHPNDSERQLGFDTALSNHIYSANPFVDMSNKEEDDYSLERATEHLTLSEAKIPPKLFFSYLKPRPVADKAMSFIDIPETVPTNDSLNQSLGARILLAEWELGSNPRDYEYINPYPDVPSPLSKGTAQQTSTSQLQRTWKQSQESAASILRQSPIRTMPAPPRIGYSQNVALAASSSQPTVPDTVPKTSQIFEKRSNLPISAPSSQMRWQPTTPFAAQSQNTVSSSSQIQPTQTRTTAPKEGQKKQKKRMGGF